MYRPVAWRDQDTVTEGQAKGRTAEVLQPFVARGGVAGLVAQVWRNGTLSDDIALGRRDIEADLPMTDDTIFLIASMTKPITTLAALRLIERGRITLSDPIARWAPELRDMKVLRTPDGPLEACDPAHREITLEDLMTHRSGLAYAFTSQGPSAQAHAVALGDLFNSQRDPDEWLSALGGLPLACQPGERFHYGHSTEVLGLVIARLEGKPLAEVLREQVFEPLRMADTGFHVSGAKRARIAAVYERTPAGPARHELPVFDTPPRFCLGGGGLATTAPDFLRFARLILARGELDGARIIRRDLVDLMITDRLTEDQHRRPAPGGFTWEACGFGLGVSVIIDDTQRSWMGRGRRGAVGWPGSLGTWWRVDPAEGLAAVFMAQDWPSSDPALTQDGFGAPFAQAAFQRALYS